jgi:hypothetical protein
MKCCAELETDKARSVPAPIAGTLTEIVAEGYVLSASTFARADQRRRRSEKRHGRYAKT